MINQSISLLDYNFKIRINLIYWGNLSYNLKVVERSPSQLYEEREYKISFKSNQKRKKRKNKREKKDRKRDRDRERQRQREKKRERELVTENLW